MNSPYTAEDLQRSSLSTVDARASDVSEYWAMLGERLDACRDEFVARFFGRLSPALASCIAHQLDGGKKLRGRLTCAVCEALGGRLADALPRAIAVECVQSASLIHDDWVDGDRVRRNAPAAWTAQGARRAVLLADVMFATSLERCAELGRAEVHVLAKAIAAVAAGAYHEPSAAGTSSTRVSYARLLYLKTGALFAAAAELGALSAKADGETRRAAAAYGARIGEAYQLADDLQDLVQAPARCTAPAVSLLLRSFALLHGELGSAEVMECLLLRRPQLQQAMERQIAARLDSAQLLLRRLPPRCHSILELLPAEILNRRTAR